MNRGKVTVDKVADKYELIDPNNDSCPKVGPFDRRKDADEAARGLNAFYRKNWSTWRDVSLECDIAILF